MSEKTIQVIFKWQHQVMAVWHLPLLGPARKVADGRVALDDGQLDIRLAPGDSVPGRSTPQRTFSLGVQESLQIKNGPLSWTVVPGIRPEAKRPSFFAELDVRFAKTLATASVFFFGLYAAMAITPVQLSDDDLLLAEHAQVFTARLEKAPPTPKKMPVEECASCEAPKTPETKKVIRKEQAPSAKDVAKPSARELAAKVLAKLDLDLGGGGNAPAAGVLSASAVQNALGRLSGPQSASLAPSMGMGARTVGDGGGGQGPIGIGKLGSGRPGGKGLADQDGLPGLGGHKATRLPYRKVNTVGALEKGEVQRVMRRHHSQIRFCYENALSKNPNLGGKIAANWQIAPNGTVSVASVLQDTMDSASVKTCVLRTIKRMRFPKPRGGGQVTVTYPFVFSSGN